MAVSINLAELTAYSTGFGLNAAEWNSRNTQFNDAAQNESKDFMFRQTIKSAIAGETLVAGDFVRISGATILKVNGSTDDGITNFFGVALEGGNATDTVRVATEYVYGLSGLTAGAKYYIGGSGTITATRPSSRVCVIGFAVTASMIFLIKSNSAVLDANNAHFSGRLGVGTNSPVSTIDFLEELSDNTAPTIRINRSGSLNTAFQIGNTFSTASRNYFLGSFDGTGVGSGANIFQIRSGAYASNNPSTATPIFTATETGSFGFNTSPTFKYDFFDTTSSNTSPTMRVLGNSTLNTVFEFANTFSTASRNYYIGTFDGSGITGGANAFKIKTSSYASHDPSAATTLMTLTESGNLGLNVVDPIGKVHIGTSSGSVYQSWCEFGDQSYRTDLVLGFGTSPGTNYLKFDMSQGSGSRASKFFMRGDGRFGVGIDPLYNLDVSGDMRVSTGVNLPGLPTGTFTPLQIDGSGTLYKTTSSLRYKKDVAPISIDSTKIYDLNFVNFTYKSTNQQAFGLIAEEVALVFPELVYMCDYSEAQDGSDIKPESIDYSMITVPIAIELKKLRDRITALGG